MKFCRICGTEIATKDGENLCVKCDDAVATDGPKKAKLAQARKQRRAREQALRDCGLVRVRGAMGGTYWE